MPRMEVLADGRLSPTTPGTLDLDDIQAFIVGGGDTVLCVIDYTAFAGRDATVSSVSWTVTNATLGTTSLSTPIASALIAIPAVTLPTMPDPLYPLPVTVQLSATMSDGRVLRSDFRLNAQPR